MNGISSSPAPPPGTLPGRPGFCAVVAAVCATLCATLLAPTLHAQTQLDYGDAPSPYPTLSAVNGARHPVVAGVHMGAFVDAEADGQPNATATGDDIAGPADDEDGVAFLTSPLLLGSSATVAVLVSIDGFLNVWVDFNRDGDWLDGSEQIFTNQFVVPGTNILTFNLPTAGVAGNTFARFRFSTQPGNTSVGIARDGEVEDYQVTIAGGNLDFGDAPKPYPTLLEENGARHTRNPEVFMGALIDVEPDGQPTATATGDDANPPGAGDDEDGVIFTAPLVPGVPNTLRVVVSVTGRFNGWVDFNANGSWLDPGEQIFLNAIVVTGPNDLSFDVPPEAVAGPTYARFRFNLQGGLRPEGPATDGEVEDYLVEIEPAPQNPCDQTSKGSDFWLTFPGNHTPEPDEDLQLSLCIAGKPGTQGNVSIPGLGFSQNYIIPVSMGVTIKLPDEADLGNSVDVIEDKGIHVTAKGTVAVYGFNHIRYTTDAFTAIPSPALGTEYFVLGYGNVHSNAPALNGSEFALVACESNTTVSITLPFDTGGHTSAVPYSITLNAGQTYQFRDMLNAPHDVSGTSILSDKPVALFSGHQCANIATKEVFFCDYVVEQNLPNNQAGTNFVVLPLRTRDGDTYRVLALQDKTDVLINGVLVATLNRGTVYEAIHTGPLRIASTRPVMVAQYSNSAIYDDVVLSDPFMTVIPPTRMFLPSYMFCVPTNDFPINYINVVTPSPGSVSIDGVAIPAALYSPIPGTIYSGARVFISIGPHLAESGGGTGAPIPFGLIVYGFNEFDSYGFPGGYGFGDTTPPVVTCTVPELTINLGGGTAVNCFALVPDLRTTVTATDDCRLADPIQVSQSPAPQTPVGPGVHPIVLSVADASGNVGTCTVILTVVDTYPVTVTCPSNVVAYCTNGDGVKVDYPPATARTTCNTNIPVVCNPPSGSIFQPGVTPVVCQAVSGGASAPASCTFTVTVRCLTGTITRTGNQGTVAWTGGGVLESTTSLTTRRWTVVATESPFTFDLDPRSRTLFFQVRYPDQ